MTPRRKKQLYAGFPAALGLGVAWFLLGVVGAVAYLLVVGIVFGGWEVFGQRDGRPSLTVRRSFWIGLLLPVGLVLLFIAERVVGEGSDQLLLWRGLAAICLLAAFAWRGYQLSRSRGAARKVEVRLAIASAGIVLGLVLYALSTEGGIAWTGLEGSAAERTRGSFSVLWLAVLAVSLGALLFMEMAYRVMPVEEAVELRRVNASGANGLTLALSLIFVASINYVANARDIKRDLSYFKTTRPSETSLRMVRALDEPVRVVLLYPRVHEVLEQLRPYFEELDEASDQLRVEVLDHALVPELAREHRVRGNGFVLLVRGEGEGQQAESFEVGTELEAARSRLRTLDGRFQQHFAHLTVRPRELYLTTGHRERSASGAEGDPEEQRLGELTSALGRSNIEIRELGIAQGLANRVPENAPAVAVVGPREPLLAEEAQSLLRYVREGGRVVVFVDPDVEHGLDPLLHGLGLALSDGVLHSERSHVRRGEPPADRAVVHSNNYSAHPTVTLATRYRRAPAIFDRGGALERREAGQIEGAQVTFPLWASDGYWLDRDGDHRQGEGEASESRYYLMAAVTVPNREGPEGRAVVIADGDFIVDAWIQNAGNAFVLMDTINWLVGEDQVLGPTQTEEDVAIEHTRDEDKVWFYGTSFAVPLPLLLLGFWLARRRYLGGRKREHAARPPAPESPIAPRDAEPEPASDAVDEEDEASPGAAREDDGPEELEERDGSEGGPESDGEER